MRSLKGAYQLFCPDLAEIVKENLMFIGREKVKHQTVLLLVLPIFANHVFKTGCFLYNMNMLQKSN